ncbi:MAG: M23 family metallopeptidase [Chloroflexi bacterium]|nr:M23 family metallopeptidase [Chloroflexota bacterium]
MKKILETIRAFFSAFGTKLKRAKRKPVPAAEEPATQPRNPTAPAAQPQKSKKMDIFSVVSWAATLLLAAGMLGGAMYYKSAQSAAAAPAAAPTTSPAKQTQTTAALPQLGAPVAATGNGVVSIGRKLQLKTNIPQRERYEAITYRVTRGDAMLSIAEKFNLKSETLLYVNAQLEDNPHNLKPGMELTIPPVDGLYYTWKEGDTFESVAEKFDTTADAIINFPGNRIDLTNPKVEPGETVMIPGGSRALQDWLIPTSGGSSSGGGGNACGGGPVASGFGWPANSHNISGNGYGPGHLALDIQANEGEPVYAAGSGMVTMAQGGWNYGYGNVIQIDHGNGYVTVYAHLSVINVSVCTPVGQGAVIGAAGNTGNSFGAHLHFEVRLNGTNVNPYTVVQ